MTKCALMWINWLTLKLLPCHPHCRLRKNCHHVAHCKTATRSTTESLLTIEQGLKWIWWVSQSKHINESHVCQDKLKEIRSIKMPVRHKWNWFYTAVIAEMIATVVIKVIAVKCKRRKKILFNLTFIHWWKEDLKQQDLMKNLGKALSVNLQY